MCFNKLITQEFIWFHSTIIIQGLKFLYETLTRILRIYIEERKKEKVIVKRKEKIGYIFFLSKRKFIITFDSILRRDTRHSGSKISIRNVDKVTIPYGPGGIEGRNREAGGGKTSGRSLNIGGGIKRANSIHASLFLSLFSRFTPRANHPIQFSSFHLYIDFLPSSTLLLFARRSLRNLVYAVYPSLLESYS